MPSEKVYGIKPFEPETDTADPPPLSRTPIVDVRWSKEGEYVQVVSRMYEAETMATRPEDSPRPLYEFGLYVDLDRRAINRLIQSLRRARDQAFGRDE